MDRKAALATAAGLVLVVAGAASALASAWTSPTAPADPSTATATPIVVTEYVDEFGNPVDPPSQIQAESIVLTRSPIGEEVIVYAEPPTIYVDVPAAPASARGSAASASFVDDDHEDEHEDEHEVEYEDEHADEDGNG
ncbi:MAG: hypothetical protein HZA58_07320 [Acidimicrobiia bacterium]|nr:hypothetical protein [Acidimicrobiia bacterium]